MLAQLQASFNRQLEECSRGILRKIDKMQQQALKARECAAQLNEAADVSAPEMSVPCIPDAVKDLESALKEPIRSGASGGDHGTTSAARGANPTDSGARRALDKMMGGKLHTENAFASLDIKADKWEAWMETVAPEAMTDAQAAKFAAYQEQLRIIKEKQESMRAKLQGELKKIRSELTAAAVQLRADLQNLTDWKLVYEEELLLNELAGARLTDTIDQETTWRKTGKELRTRLEASRSTIQETNRELQKQQCSCWLLEDERTSAQHEHRDKTAALTAALGTVHLPSEVLSVLSKRLDDALAPQGTQNQGGPVEAEEEPEQALRRECAALSSRLDMAVGSLKAEFASWSDGPLCKLLEASRDNAYAQRRLVLASEAADAEQQKLTRLKTRLELSQTEESALRLQLEASSEALEKAQRDVDLLLRVKRGIVGELPSRIVALREPFDFSDSCLVSQREVDSYKQDIIASGRQKLRILQAIKLEAKDVSERTKDVHLLRITRSMQRILQMPGGGMPANCSVVGPKQQKEMSGHQWVSQLATDGFKDAQESEVQLERLEEARAELEKRSAAVTAEIKQRVCSMAYASKHRAGAKGKRTYWCYDGLLVT
ncbi:uncharacterized protein EMH_0021900 [Eimeria mitis]|uniref:Uncharacterized protein n=1 Tax=Eimeria mitis TaxID=44415 RepID=U6K038_9EIME|nr:uncharacterized protein EMH_0021900 [Eimeria mitis]CDJ29128.1 hypothetical protein, conserved [Eimeria mitis]